MRTNYKNFTNEKNEVNNEMLRDILKKLNINDFIIDQIIVRYYTSNLIKQFLKELTELKESENPINLVLSFFLTK